MNDLRNYFGMGPNTLRPSTSSNNVNTQNLLKHERIEITSNISSKKKASRN